MPGRTSVEGDFLEPLTDLHASHTAWARSVRTTPHDGACFHDRIACPWHEVGPALGRECLEWHRTAVPGVARWLIVEAFSDKVQNNQQNGGIVGGGT